MTRGLVEDEKKEEETEKKAKKAAPAKPRKKATKKPAPKKRPDLEAHPTPEKEEKAPPKTEKSAETPPKIEKKPEEKPLEYKNDIVEVSVYHKPGCRIEMQIKASQDMVKEAHKKAIRTVSKQVNFPGFRKGKAPPEMILKNHPRDVDKSWQQVIADVAFKEAQSLAKVSLLD
ncbi:MAG: Trigger factor, partial [Chlamydiae bacterium]|nr:Trigger factor [Chlamydiota bacterium]